MYWVKQRHRILKRLLSPFISIVVKYGYHCSLEPFAGNGRNYLFLVNHQTDIDQFIVSAMFHEPVYFVAMEDLFSRGLFSRLMQWGAAPIPILKGSYDAAAVKKCLRVAKEGGTIAVFPEGNRTYSGMTCYIRPQIAKLVKFLKLPVAILRIEGGYGIKPRWSDYKRNGKMKAYVSRIIEPEEFMNMGNQELYELIRSGLNVDEALSGADYTGEHLAEGLERVLYYCPECSLTEYQTRGDIIICKKCGKTYQLLSNQKIKSLSSDTPFSTVKDWYATQESFIRHLDPELWKDKAAFEDTVNVYEIVPYKRKKPFAENVRIALFGDRIELPGTGAKHILCFDDVNAMACIAVHKLNVYHKMGIFQIDGNQHFNALKYCNFYYHYKFKMEGNEDGKFQFLGL